MMPYPSAEVLECFGVHVIAALGGRLNQHWLVAARGEQVVLRRWAQSADDIGYELRLLSQLAALGWPVAPALAGPIELNGYFWSLAPFLPGDPPPDTYSVVEQRARAAAG
jgi:aminoglycoside phosphotransferase (APT) family kinase protein